MGDAVGECFGILCTCCCICTGEGIEQWCFFNRWGSGSNTSSSGCCTSCCKRSFDDDDFDREERKLREEREAREAREREIAGGDTVATSPSTPPGSGERVVSTQPTGAQMMSDRPRSSQESMRRNDALVKEET